MKRLSPSALIDDEGRLHLSIPDMLDELGVADTPENRQRCEEMAVEFLKEMLKDFPAVIYVTD